MCESRKVGARAARGAPDEREERSETDAPEKNKKEKGVSGRVYAPRRQRVTELRLHGVDLRRLGRRGEVGLPGRVVLRGEGGHVSRITRNGIDS